MTPLAICSTAFGAALLGLVAYDVYATILHSRAWAGPIGQNLNFAPFVKARQGQSIDAVVLLELEEDGGVLPVLRGRRLALLLTAGYQDAVRRGIVGKGLPCPQHCDGTSWE